ncbi:MAG: transglutaminase TgpA family protein [Actinomycetota bacterium]
MAGLTRRFHAPRELAVSALVAAAALPLSRLFRPGGFTGVILTVVVLSVGVSWGLRRLRVPPQLSLLASLVALVWYVAARFYPDTLTFIFPSPASIRAIANGIHSGVQQTIDEAVPVIASRELLMFVAAGTWVTGWLVDAAASIGNPLLALGASIPLFAAPGTLLPSERRWVDTGLYLAAAAWVLFSEERALARRWRTNEDVQRSGWRAGPAVRIAFVGLLVVLIMAPFLPGYGAAPLLRSKGPGTRISFNPFVAILPTLRQAPQVGLFTVVTSQPEYLRLTTLEHFNGEVWSQGRSRATIPIGEAPISAFEPQIPTQQVEQHFQIQALAGPWLPAEYDPVSVNGVRGLRIETETRAVILPEASGLPVGARYDVTSRVPQLTAADLDRPFTYDTSALSDYLETGGTVPRQVRDIAQRVAGDKPTPYQKALALQDYLRTFTYDERVAAGHSFKNIVEFLTKSKRGYCEQFASAMAIMARTIGLPSRVAIGFGFGRQLGHEMLLTTREAHAWVEIYFPNAGWVTFEPTPRAGVTQVPAYAAPGATGSPTPTPSATGSTQPTAAPNTPGAQHGPAEDVTGGVTTSTGRPAWVLAVAIAGGIVALVGLAFLISLALRWVGRWRARDMRSAAVVRYVEFLTWCAGAGLGRDPGETPSEHAARLGAESSEAVLPLVKLALLADEALWGPNDSVDPDGVARWVDEARDALKETMTRHRRLLAAAGWGRWRPAA